MHVVEFAGFNERGDDCPVSSPFVAAYPSAEGRLAQNRLASSPTPSRKTKRKDDERTG